MGISRLNLYQKIRNLEVESIKKRISTEDALKALEESRGNKALAARKLGIQRQTLYQKLNKIHKKS